MSNIKLNNINETTNWADLVEEEEKKAPAAAGAGTPPPKEEKGWKEVPKRKNGKKTQSRTTDPATAGVARELKFGDKKPTTNLNKNPFALLAADLSSDEEEDE
jgi:hypothetical protein